MDRLGFRVELPALRWGERVSTKHDAPPCEGVEGISRQLFFQSGMSWDIYRDPLTLNPAEGRGDWGEALVLKLKRPSAGGVRLGYLVFNLNLHILHPGFRGVRV